MEGQSGVSTVVDVVDTTTAPHKFQSGERVFVRLRDAEEEFVTCTVKSVDDEHDEITCFDDAYTTYKNRSLNVFPANPPDMEASLPWCIPRVTVNIPHASVEILLFVLRGTRANF